MLLIQITEVSILVFSNTGLQATDMGPGYRLGTSLLHVFADRINDLAVLLLLPDDCSASPPVVFLLEMDMT